MPRDWKLRDCLTVGELQAILAKLPADYSLNVVVFSEGDECASQQCGQLGVSHEAGAVMFYPKKVMTPLELIGAMQSVIEEAN